MYQRLLTLDVYRGVGVLLMILFHLLYDLDYFDLIVLDTTRVPLLVHLRTLIVTIFMSAVGMSLYIVYRRPHDPNRHRRRLLLLLGTALLISLTTYLMFPQTWIYFGVLHMIFLAYLVGPYFTKTPAVAGILGSSIILLYATDVLTMRPLFALLQPLLELPARHTEDLAPFLPWFGVVLLGIYFMHLGWIEKVALPRQGVIQDIAWLGRHSLIIYLLHQPLLFIILSSVTYLFI